MGGPSDRDLGMVRKITRRDLLDGALLTAGALSAAALGARAQTEAAYYPPRSQACADRQTNPLPSCMRCATEISGTERDRRRQPVRPTIWSWSAAASAVSPQLSSIASKRA